MKFSDEIGANPPDASMVHVWKSASLAGTWRYPADWDCPEAWILAANAGQEGDALASAVSGLAAERAMIGVGIDEALDDLEAFFQASISGTTPTSMVRRFVEAWTEQQAASLLAVRAKDPSTGLYNLDTFVERLRDVYLEEARGKISRPPQRRLVFVDAPSEGSDFFTRLDNHIRVGQAISFAFRDGEAATTLAVDRYAVLAYDETDASTKLKIVRERLSRACPSRSVEFDGHHLPLPSTVAATLALLVRHGAAGLFTQQASAHFS